MKIMESKISATDVQRSFSEVLNRVRYRGESFVIQRGGQVVARIVPASAPRMTLGQLAALLASLPTPDPGFAADVAGVAGGPPTPEPPTWGT